MPSIDDNLEFGIPLPEIMASYQYLLEQTNLRLESPAKVFAKLKSKVHREGRCAQDGTSTGSDPLCNVKYVAEFKSPRKTTVNEWMNNILKENQGFVSRNEAQALTISPISSPQKNFGCLSSYSSNKPVKDMSPVFGRGPGCTPRKGTFLESTAMSQPLFMVDRKPIHAVSAQISNLNAFNVNSRTPVKIESDENDCMFEKEQDAQMSSASIFSPVRNKLRKRKLEPWGFSNVSSSTKDIIQLQESKMCGDSEGQPQNNIYMENLVHGRGFPVGRADHFTLEPMFSPPGSTAKKRCAVVLDKLPPMSPAKMFAFMKAREKAEQPEIPNVSNDTKDLFDRGECVMTRMDSNPSGKFHQPNEAPPSTAPTMGGKFDTGIASVAESAVPVSQSREESADNESDVDPAEDVRIPAAPSQPVLLEDPLILNSPRISIPKKHNSCPQPSNIPSESVIYLKRWFLRRNHKGLFLDGIHREENIPWNSNIILERVSNYVVKTVSGRVYILVGKINLHVNCGFPKWFLKKFVSGFPVNWNEIYEKFLSESRNPSRETERRSRGRAGTAKTNSKAPSINISVTRQRTRSLKTPSPPASSSSTKVSRSGRVIKPPLEYWRGGRVILDAHMNVTIYQCYETSICNPEVTTTVSARSLQKPVCPDRKQCKTTNDKEASVPMRKVKVPPRRHNRVKVTQKDKPSYSLEPPAKTLNSSEEWPGRRTRSSQRCQAAEATSHVDTDLQKYVEKPSTLGANRSKRDTQKSSLRVSRRKGSVSASPQSIEVRDETSQDQSSDDSLNIKRTKQGQALYRKRGEESPQHLAEKSRKELRRATSTKNKEATQTTKYKQSKSSMISQPTKPQTTQSNKKQKLDKGSTLIPQEQNEDEQTEAELAKLTEWVFSAERRKRHSGSDKTSQDQPLDDTLNIKRTKQGRGQHRKRGEESPRHLAEEGRKEPRGKAASTKNQSSKKQKQDKGSALIPQEQNEDEWTEAELTKLKEAVMLFPKHVANYWANVAKIVKTRSAEECHNQHTSHGTFQSPAKKTKRPKKKPVEASKGPDNPVISAGLGTFKRKQQVRHFLETMPRENVDDVFSCPYMQSKRFEIPSTYASSLSDDRDFTMTDTEPVTPMSTGLPEVKTPQCLHITPGMMGSPNRTNDDKYVYQLQKRMKKRQFNVCKQAASSKSFTPTPSVKRTMRRCGNVENDAFVVWEMFPGNNGALSESGEEEDFYFSDNDMI